LAGWAGNLLHVDLTRRKVAVENLPKSLAHTYIGGRGFGSKILYDEMNIKTDPLGPENVLIFSTGPLTGTIWPSSGRCTVTAKSPLTGFLGDANMGGSWGPELKYAGYDAVIIRGKSKNPVYLWIDDDQVEIRNASYLWGGTTWETEKAIKAELGDPKIKIASIGQAGENLVRFACVITSLFRAAGRTGMGAVMGSKLLKAIAVRGTKDVNVDNPERFYKLAQEAFQRIRESPYAEPLSMYGTAYLVSLINETGALPTMHFQTGFYPQADQVDGETLKEKYFIRKKGCYSCPICCGRYCIVKNGAYAHVHGKGPEYETIDSFGPRCGNSNLESIIKANELCNKYGMDTISCGSVIAFAMELFEKGILKSKDTEGYDLSWGNHEDIVRMVSDIAFRRGLGRILAEGERKAAEIIGRGAEKYAVHVKGLEFSANEPRALKEFGLGYVTATRGADHLRALPCLGILHYEKELVDLFGSEAIPDMIDPVSPHYKGKLVKYCEDYMAVSDMLEVCKYTTAYYIVRPEDLAQAFSLATGITMETDELLRAGERLINLERLILVREGISRKDDTLPKRFLKHPMPEGPSKGSTVELEEMLNEYYKERGWNSRGVPAKSKLKDLGI